MLGIFGASQAYGQTATTTSPGSAFIDTLEKHALQVLVQNPDLVNDEAAKALLALKAKSPGAYNFIRDLNLKFKTFQAANQPTGIGFSYQYDNSWTSYKKTPGHVFSQSANLNFDGNVAFKKVYNPTNFLESKFGYNGTFIWGGQAKVNTAEGARMMLKLDSIMFAANDQGNKQQSAQARDQGAAMIGLTNQFFIGASANASYESNQDFTSKQFVPGAVVNLAVKPWKQNGTLSWFNLPDYPFALLRWITGSNFAISRASFPSALVGFDYVVPQNDSLRKAVTGALNPYTRLRFEAAFKTKAAVIYDQVFWFSADYRWYHQLGASQAIVNAKIDNFNYFVCALTASNGFFVSYSYGQLPFDKKANAVYGLGFKYDLGNLNFNK